MDDTTIIALSALGAGILILNKQIGQAGTAISQTAADVGQGISTTVGGVTAPVSFWSKFWTEATSNLEAFPSVWDSAPSYVVTPRGAAGMAVTPEGIEFEKAQVQTAYLNRQISTAQYEHYMGRLNYAAQFMQQIGATGLTSAQFDAVMARFGQ